MKSKSVALAFLAILMAFMLLGCIQPQTDQPSDTDTGTGAIDTVPDTDVENEGLSEIDSDWVSDTEEVEIGEMY